MHGTIAGTFSVHGMTGNQQSQIIWSNTWSWSSMKWRKAWTIAFAFSAVCVTYARLWGIVPGDGPICLLSHVSC